MSRTPKGVPETGPEFKNHDFLTEFTGLTELDSEHSVILSKIRMPQKSTSDFFQIFSERPVLRGQPARHRAGVAASRKRAALSSEFQHWEGLPRFTSPTHLAR